MGLLVAIFHTLLRLCRASLADAVHKREPQGRSESTGEVGDEMRVPRRGNASDPLGRGLRLPMLLLSFQPRHVPGAPRNDPLFACPGVPTLPNRHRPRGTALGLLRRVTARRSYLSSRGWRARRPATVCGVLCSCRRGGGRVLLAPRDPGGRSRGPGAYPDTRHSVRREQGRGHPTPWPERASGTLCSPYTRTCDPAPGVEGT